MPFLPASPSTRHIPGVLNFPTIIPHLDKGKWNFLILIQALLSSHICPMIDFFPGKLTGIFFPRENSALTLKSLIWLPTTQLFKVYSNTFYKIYFIHIWVILCIGPLSIYMILVVVQILKYHIKFSKKNLSVQFHWYSYGCLKYSRSSNNVISFNIVCYNIDENLIPRTYQWCEDLLYILPKLTSIFHPHHLFSMFRYALHQNVSTNFHVFIHIFIMILFKWVILLT